MDALAFVSGGVILRQVLPNAGQCRHFGIEKRIRPTNAAAVNCQPEVGFIILCHAFDRLSALAK